MLPLQDRSRLLGLVAVFLLALPGRSLAGGLQSGKGRASISPTDPYTKEDPEALAKAGYLDLHPSQFADHQSTQKVQEALGGVPVLFLVTEHFRIASSLDEYKLGDRASERKKLRAALGRLKQKLPKVNAKARVLDPWLRLHLYADLLEETYARFQAEFGLEQLPAGGPDEKASSNYLGMQAPFSVLLTDKRSELDRYSQSYCQTSSDTILYDHFADSDSMFLGVSFEGLQSVEEAMRFAVVYGTVRNLVLGYGGRSYYGASFWHVGLARWFARQGNEQVIAFFDPPGTPVQRRQKDTEWSRKVRARVLQDYYPSAAELLLVQDERELSFSDHMMLWSRLDFLMSKPLAMRRKMLELMAKPLPWQASQEDYLKQFQVRFRESLQEAFGWDLESFDTHWVDFVSATYKKR